ncbi:hypothetical protein RSAG8_13635, partial [Rhizoctonia solani AG-8 WAC10335]
MALAHILEMVAELQRMHMSSLDIIKMKELQKFLKIHLSITVTGTRLFLRATPHDTSCSSHEAPQAHPAPSAQIWEAKTQSSMTRVIGSISNHS